MKKTLSLLLSMIFALSSLLLLSSCDDGQTLSKNGSKVEVKSYYTLEYFDTYCSFKDYSGSSEERNAELVALVEGEIELCHKLFDIYNDYGGINNLKTVNDSRGGAPVPVDGRIIELIKISKEMHSVTEGNTNIAMGAVTRLWHDCREEAKEPGVVARIPDWEDLLEASTHTNINDVVIDEVAGTVTILDPALTLDVGAIAKGYAAERVAKLLESEGVKAYLLDFGGNIRVGEKLDGSGFSAGIENPVPYSPDAYARTLEIKNCALVTSASTKRSYTVEINGQTESFHHIINKDTLMPENKYLSVTVQHSSSAIADALTTGFFNMDETDIRRAVSNLAGVEVTLVYHNSDVVVINGAE